jgi:hypothetical protein
MSAAANYELPAEEDVLPGDNIYVRELMDILLKEASRIAQKSSEHSADDLLIAAGFYALGELPRLQIRRPNAWNLFLRLEKDNSPEELRKQQDGVSYNKSRPGLKGDYQRYMKERWDKEPELRKKYQRLAKGSSTLTADVEDEHLDSDQENDEIDPTSVPEALLKEQENVEVELKSTKLIQKKSLKTLKKLVRYTFKYSSLHGCTC